jgi:hypothetical protein
MNINELTIGQVKELFKLFKRDVVGADKIYDDQDDIDDLISRYQINEGQCMYCNSSLNANVDDNYDISHENIKCPNCNKWQHA